MACVNEKVWSRCGTCLWPSLTRYWNCATRTYFLCISCDLALLQVSSIHRRASPSWLPNDCSSSRLHTLVLEGNEREWEFFPRILSQSLTGSGFLCMKGSLRLQRDTQIAMGLSCVFSQNSWAKNRAYIIAPERRSPVVSSTKRKCPFYVLEKSPATTANESKGEKRFQVCGTPWSPKQSAGNRFEASFKQSSLAPWCPGSPFPGGGFPFPVWLENGLSG